MRSRTWLYHAAHVLLPGLGLGYAEALALRLSAAVALFLGLFTLLHDAMHGALSLPRRWNELLLTALGITLGVSGHAARFLHLRHHAHPFGPEDDEGREASSSALAALSHAPLNYLRFPAIAWRRMPATTRPLQLVEWVGVAGFALGLLARADLRVYGVVVAAAQLTVPLWAAWLPHRAPRRVLATARRLLWTYSPVVIGLALHDAHHARPRLSAYALVSAQIAQPTVKPST